MSTCWRCRRIAASATASATCRRTAAWSPRFTVEDNIRLPTWTTEQRRRRAAARTGSSRSCRRSRPSAAGARYELSGGQQKMVALARALMAGTRMLLLDEPFEGLAPALARRLGEVMASLKGEGLSILIAEFERGARHRPALARVPHRAWRGGAGVSGSCEPVARHAAKSSSRLMRQQRRWRRRPLSINIHQTSSTANKAGGNGQIRNRSGGAARGGSALFHGRGRYVDDISLPRPVPRRDAAIAARARAHQAGRRRRRRRPRPACSAC